MVPTSQKRPCFFCGKRPTHDRAVCPARGALCSSCHKRGHFAKACRSTNTPVSRPEVAAFAKAYSFTTSDSTFPPGLQSSSLNITISNHEVRALIDTGSSENFVSHCLVSRLSLPTTPYMGTVAMASSSWTSCLFLLPYSLYYQWQSV